MKTLGTYLTHKILGGFFFGISAILVFGVFIWVQAVAPGTIQNPTFGPNDDDVKLDLCAWRVSNIKTNNPDNPATPQPWISASDVTTYKPSGICKCAESTNIATELARTNSDAGFLATENSLTTWRCRKTGAQNYCGDARPIGQSENYFIYLACKL